MKRNSLFLLFATLVLAIVTSCTDREEVVLPPHVGSWKLISYCGTPAEIDLYIQFTQSGDFTILQRTGSIGYTEYRGRYTVDEEAYILSGIYNDGQKWACDYMYGFNSDNELVLTSLNEAAEVSVYKPAQMPTVGITNSICNINPTNREVVDIKKPL